MKYLNLWTLALASVLGVGPLCAQNRTAAEMESIASHFFQNSARRAPGHSIGAVGTLSVTAVSSASTYRVYAPAEGDGFVIVSTDQRQPAVLGFAESGTYSVDQMPPAMVEFLEGTAGNPEGEHLITRAATEIEPLLGDIAFNQTEPFNNLCPLSNGSRTVTGCVATAMSEVMAYYQYPKAMTGDDISYTSTTNQLAVTWSPASTTFDWDNILAQYLQADTPYTADESVGSDGQFGCNTLSASDGNIVATEVWNCFGGDFTGTLQLLLTSTDKTFIRPIGAAKSITLGSYYYYNSLSFTPGMPSDLPDGTYRIYLGSKSEGSTEWSIMQHVSVTDRKTYTDTLYLEVRKSGLVNTVGDITFATNYSDVQANAVATLLAASGASINANYGVGETSASGQQMTRALYENFGYDDGMAYVGADNYPSTARVEEAIVAELEAQRPVLVGGDSESGGHQFVIDGVKSLDDTPYFHFNWGWGGYNNGWFLLNLNNEQAADGVATNEYCYDFDFVLGCKPDDGVESPIILSGDKLSTDAAQYMPGDVMTLVVYNFFNRSPRTFVGSIKAYLIPEAGGDECLLGTFAELDGLPTSYGFYDLDVDFAVPATVADGLYTIELRTQADGSSVVGPTLFGAQPEIRIGEEVASIEVPINQLLGVATFYWDKPATIPAGVEAFTGTLSDDNTTFTLNQITTGVIPAYTGVILSAPTQESVTMVSTAAVASIPSDLMGSLTDIATSEVAVSDSSVWVISCLEDGSEFGFYEYVGDTIYANRAYLRLARANKAPAVHIPLGVEVGYVTAIEQVKTDAPSVPVIYDLQGRRLSKTLSPGLYIMDGRKVLVK